jgi:hypothetical protein
MKNKQQIIWYLVGYFFSSLEVRAKSEIQSVIARATESSFLLSLAPLISSIFSSYV